MRPAAFSIPVPGNTVSVTPPLDPDAQAYITFYGITDPTLISALNTLVLDYKNNNLWNKRLAINPMAGGTALLNAGNIRDITRPMTFYGGWTHTANGAQGDGITGYCDHGYNENVDGINGDHSFGFYSRTDVDGLYCDMGCVLGSTESNIFSKFGNTIYPRVQNTNSGAANATGSLGWFWANRDNALSVEYYENGAVNTLGSVFAGRPNANYFLGACNNVAVGSITFYSPRQYAGAVWGQSLSDAEALIERGIWQTFNTTLGRAV